MNERDERNRKIIQEFRDHAGIVGGPFEGIPLLLLHHRGAKTGTARINPLAYRRDGDNYVVFASKGGAPENPDWYHNVRANPDVEVEVETRTLNAKAREALGDERNHLWTLQKRDYPGFASYEEKTTRDIPVIVLEPVT